MSTIFINCNCGESFEIEICSEGWIECPMCKKRIYRKFNTEQDTYTFLEEEEVK